MSTPPTASTAEAAAASGTAPAVLAATAASADASLVERARAFAEPLIASEPLETGENMLAHADAVARILRDMAAGSDLQAAAYLVYASEMLSRPHDVIAKAFGEAHANLAVETARLIKVQRLSRATQAASAQPDDPAVQTENVRKMLLAFSRDLRAVLLRLASRLQTLRWHAAQRKPLPAVLARETQQVFAPLANRLGIWQIKWELEDLALRFLEPDTYKQIARWLDEKRADREAYMAALRERLARELGALGIHARVEGRPKHIYSIVRKMRGKGLDFNHVFDVRALRVIVPGVDDCYAVLAWVHQHFTPIPEEFDDYIAKPKPNGYQSLHTVVRDPADGKPVEIQIRTEAMHAHAEHGVAAHWAYKEAGTKGYAGVSATSGYDAKIAVLRQLLAWERDLCGAVCDKGLFDDRIYVLTPEAAVIELPQGATPVDFAYAVHTSLGHRCRGARVDGAMVPLNTPLKNGQTVEIIAAKEGGPSRDWLNAEHGFIASARSRAKVRAWFNAQMAEATAARGREAVEKLLQREGKTAIRLEDLASQLGFRSAQALFDVVGKDEYSLRNIEAVLRPSPATTAAPEDEQLLRKLQGGGTSDKPAAGGVLVVGVDSLLTQLARCCRPAPPDAISGFITRGRGVSVHRSDCSNFREIAARHPERVIPVTWGGAARSAAAVYPVDVAVEAVDRQGLLRDISEVFARERLNVIGVQTQSVKGVAWMTFTVEVPDAERLGGALAAVRAVAGVRRAHRR